MSGSPERRFPDPMRRSEMVFGWLFLIIYVFLLPRAVAYFSVRILPGLGISLNGALINFLFYALSFVILIIGLFRFLRSGFHRLLDNLWPSLKAIGLGFILYYLLMFLVNALCMATLGDAMNPNEESVREAAELDSRVMLAVAVLLGPVVEELLFRGVVFGSIRRISRAAAYIVSCLLFSLYHIWQYFSDVSPWMFLIYLVQYLPGGICLGRTYEKSGSIWASIALHALINYISMSAMSLYN